jgi:hypothetical protein
MSVTRLGELLAGMPIAKGTRGQKLTRISGGAIAEPPETDAPTLADLGLNKKVSMVAQQLSNLAEDVAITDETHPRR